MSKEKEEKTLYVRKELNFYDLMDVLMFVCMIGIPVLFMGKFLVSIYFIFWVGTVMLKMQTYEIKKHTKIYKD